MQKTKELEHQLAEAKLEHVTCSMQQETIRFEKEQGTVSYFIFASKCFVLDFEKGRSILKGMNACYLIK